MFFLVYLICSLVLILEVPTKDYADHMNAGGRSSGDLDGLDLRFGFRRFRRSNSEYAVLHGRLHLIQHDVLRQPESPEELAAASLHSMPFTILLLALSAPLSTYFEHLSFFELHFHLFLVESRKVGLEDVGISRLLPVDPSVGDGGDIVCEGMQGRGGKPMSGLKIN